MEIFWSGTGFLLVLNGHKIQWYSLTCPSALPNTITGCRKADPSLPRGIYTCHCSKPPWLCWDLVLKQGTGWKEVIWRSHLELPHAKHCWKKRHSHECLNMVLVLEVLVLIAFFEILATKCDAQQGTNAFRSTLGCVRLPARATPGREKNCDFGSDFFTKSFSFRGEGEITLKSGVDVYGKLIANVAKKERCRVLQTEAAALWTAGSIDFRLQQRFNIMSFFCFVFVFP